MWITTNYGKSLKEMGIADHLTCLRVTEQKTGSKLRKEYIKAVYCHPAYLIYMQSISCEVLGWMKQARIKISGRNINDLSNAYDNTLMAENKEELKS